MSRKTERKSISHAAIVASAAALMRTRGIEATSVADVMRGAGLTVGGFYNHFASKEHLFAHVIRSTAGALWAELLEGAHGTSASERAASIARRYLSPAHRDHPEAGCLLPTVVPEVARSGEPYRGALAAQLEGFATSLSDVLGGRGERDEALALLALMFGALTLSRALAGTELGDEILQAARRAAPKVAR